MDTVHFAVMSPHPFPLYVLLQCERWLYISMPPRLLLTQKLNMCHIFVLQGSFFLSIEIKPRNGWNGTKVGSHHVRKQKLD